MANNVQAVDVARDAEPALMPRVPLPNTYLPSHLMALNVAMKCIPLNARSGIRTRFEEAVLRGTASVAGSSCICATPVRWFEEGFWATVPDFSGHVCQ